MPHDNTAPPARISIGPHEGGDLYGTPRAGQVPVPRTAAVILGWTVDRKPVIIAAVSLEWLDALESAIQVARAQGIAEAGMKLVAP